MSRGRKRRRHWEESSDEGNDEDDAEEEEEEGQEEEEEEDEEEGEEEDEDQEEDQEEEEEEAEGADGDDDASVNLTELLGHHKESVQAAAITLLGELRVTSSAVGVAKLLSSPSHDVQKHAFCTLQKFGKKASVAASIIAGSLGKRNSEYSHGPKPAEEKLLAKLGSGAKEALPMLRKQLATPQTCRAAGRVIAKLGTHATSAISDLQKHLGSPSNIVRSNAMETLRSLQKVVEVPSMQTSLMKLLKHADPGVRQDAAKWVQMLSPAQAKSQDLHALLLDEVPTVRAQAALTLAEKGDVAALSELIKILAPLQAPKTRGSMMSCWAAETSMGAAIEGLAKLGEQAASAAPVLIEGLKYDIECNANFRCQHIFENRSLASAPEALCKMGRARVAICALRPLLQHKVFLVRAAAVRVLGRFGKRAPVDALKERLNDTSNLVKGEANQLRYNGVLGGA